MHNITINNIFWESIEESQLSIKLMADNYHMWNSVIKDICYCPVSYTIDFIKYQDKYMSENVDTYYNFSMILMYKDLTVGIWPFSVMKQGDDLTICSNEGPVLPPLFKENISSKIKKKLVDDILKFIRIFCLKENITGWNSCESPINNSHSIWHKKMCDLNNIKLEVTHELYVNLTLEISEIKSCFRKSYKSLINKGKELWNVDIIYNKQCNEVFQEFKLLHHEVAGRVTRSNDTWELQEEAIVKGNAFLITIRNDDNKLVGGGLFHISNDEALYAVGVYDRSLFDQPLGHVVQMEAIKYMKSLDLVWYKIGDRPYKSLGKGLTEKEYTIGYFKEGFSTDSFFKIKYFCNIKDEQHIL